MHLPRPLIDYVNARAAASDYNVTVTSIEFQSSQDMLTRLSATKFGMTVELIVTGTITFDEGELLISAIQVEAADAGFLKRKVVDWFSKVVLWGWGDTLAEHGIRMRR